MCSWNRVSARLVCLIFGVVSNIVCICVLRCACFKWCALLEFVCSNVKSWSMCLSIRMIYTYCECNDWSHHVSSKHTILYKQHESISIRNDLIHSHAIRNNLFTPLLTLRYSINCAFTYSHVHGSMQHFNNSYAKRPNTQKIKHTWDKRHTHASQKGRK